MYLTKAIKQIWYKLVFSNHINRYKKASLAESDQSSATPPSHMELFVNQGPQNYYWIFSLLLIYLPYLFRQYGITAVWVHILSFAWNIMDGTHSFLGGLLQKYRTDIDTRSRTWVVASNILNALQLIGLTVFFFAECGAYAFAICFLISASGGFYDVYRSYLIHQGTLSWEADFQDPEKLKKNHFYQYIKNQHQALEEILKKIEETFDQQDRDQYAWVNQKKTLIQLIMSELESEVLDLNNEEKSHDEKEGKPQIKKYQSSFLSQKAKDFYRSDLISKGINAICLTVACIGMSLICFADTYFPALIVIGLASLMFMAQNLMKLVPKPLYRNRIIGSIFLAMIIFRVADYIVSRYVLESPPLIGNALHILSSSWFLLACASFYGIYRIFERFLEENIQFSWLDKFLLVLAALVFVYFGLHISEQIPHAPIIWDHLHLGILVETLVFVALLAVLFLEKKEIPPQKEQKVEQPLLNEINQFSNYERNIFFEEFEIMTTLNKGYAQQQKKQN